MLWVGVCCCYEVANYRLASSFSRKTHKDEKRLCSPRYSYMVNLSLTCFNLNSGLCSEPRWLLMYWVGDFCFKQERGLSSLLVLLAPSAALETVDLRICINQLILGVGIRSGFKSKDVAMLV